MSKQKLDLFKLTAGQLAKPGTGPAQIVWRDPQYPSLPRRFPDDVPNCLFSEAFSPDVSSSTHPAKDPAVLDSSRSDPDSQFGPHPVRNRYRSNVASLSDQIDDGPVVLPLFKVSHSQVHSFLPPQAAGQQKCKEGAIPFPFQPLYIRRLPKRTALFQLAKGEDSANLRVGDDNPTTPFASNLNAGENLEASFSERYATLSDEELLHIAGDRRDLLPEAAVALDAEMARRGLTHEHARAKKREELRFDINEARAHYPKRKKSKYFVEKLNLRAYFIGLAVPVLLMVLSPSHHPFQDVWWPLFVVYISALIACLAVQPWVRQTLYFWLCLAISFVPQFVVARWLAVYHPARSNSGAKGSAFLSMFAGWVLGGTLFLLLEKLKLVHEPKAID